ncbi:hypothetical protein Tco_0666656, partial [Tanacetum coccineum]
MWLASSSASSTSLILIIYFYFYFYFFFYEATSQFLNSLTIRMLVWGEANSETLTKQSNGKIQAGALRFVLCMRTRSSSNLIGNSSSNPTNTNPKRRNRRRSKQPFSLKESPVVTGNGYPRKGQKSKPKRQNRARERKERKEKSKLKTSQKVKVNKVKSKSTPGSGF